MFYAKKSYCILDPTEKTINGPWEIVFILVCLREKCYMTLSCAFDFQSTFSSPPKTPVQSFLVITTSFHFSACETVSLGHLALL